MNAERKSTRFSWNKTSASPRSTAIPPAYGEHQILFYLFLPALFLVLAPSAAAQSVGLTWSASASIVIGYNIYRGNQPGGPYNLLNSSLDRGTTYTDATVQAGKPYYYVATAVSSSGVESGYSNEVQVTVPLSYRLSINPASLSFGNIAVGISNSQSVTLTNSGTARVTVSEANLTGAGFYLSGLSLPLTLAVFLARQDVRFL